jgi:glycosidase
MLRLLLWLVPILGLPLFSPAEETASKKCAWAEEAVWYQIFPERFRNGDPKNDPTAEYARVPDKAKAKWKIMPWIKDWYALEDWEKEIGSDVYATNGSRRYGGDFQGIIDRLDYL